MSNLAAKEPGIDRVVNYVRYRLGLTMPSNRAQSIKDAIGRAMKTCGVQDAEHLLPLLQTHSRVFDVVIDELTVGETYFFRDPSLFALIQRMILPDLDRNRPAGCDLQVWSAGCATGEEAYTLAIVLEEAGLAERGRVVGTDISRRALEQARAGIYGRWSLRADAGQLAARYFTQVGDRFQLADRFRSRVRFDFLNLASDFSAQLSPKLPPMDLIMCRNVMIYFDSAAIRQLARRLFDSLADGGWLLTGPSDPPLWQHAPFRTIVTANGVLYRRDDRALSRPEDLPAVHAKQMRTAELRSAGWKACRRGGAMRPVSVASANRPAAAQQPIDRAAQLAAVRELADRGESAAAERAVLALIDQDPLALEPRYLLAVLLIAAGRKDDAISALRRLVYLDPDLAPAYMLLGTVQLSMGNISAARRAFENAFALSAEKPEHEIMAFSEGETARDVAQAAKRHLEQLATRSGDVA